MLVKDIKGFQKKKKEKKQQYGGERYKNLPEDEKQQLVEYRKKYKIRKNILLHALLFSFRKSSLFLENIFKSV